MHAHIGPGAQSVALGERLPRLPVVGRDGKIDLAALQRNAEKFHQAQTTHDFRLVFRHRHESIRIGAGPVARMEARA